MNTYKKHRAARADERFFSSRGARSAGWIGLLIAATISLRAAPPGNINDWTLIWSDEFNGTSTAAISSALWRNTSQLPWGGNHHNSSYASVVESADSYQDGNGHLVLRCRYVPGGIVAADGTTQYYTEGMLNNFNINNFTYGYVEVSAQYPTSPSSQWPAFWLNSAGAWPPEVDIAEYFGDNGSGGYMHNALAWPNGSGGASWDNTTFYDGDYGSFHAYGLDWGESYVTWFKDGTAKKSNTTAADVPAQPMYVILNSGVATSPAPGTSGYPSYAYFDYCRYYRRSELIYNGDFEAYYASWNLANNASTASGKGIGGSVAMRLDTASSGVVNSTASQTVYGLLPNTSYVLTCWYQNDASQNQYWPGLNVNVNAAGGGSLLATAWGGTPNWTQGSASFTTGPLQTNATVSFQVQPTWGRIFIDNVQLRRAATVNNSGFETSYDDPYWHTSGSSYGGSYLLQYGARSGSYSQQFHAGTSAWQEVAGLRTNTTYQFKFWATGPNSPGLQATVTNADGVNASTTINPNNAYQAGTVTFTTGGTNTTATITLSVGNPGYDTVYFADDLFLAEPLNAPWQGQDIGTVVLAGTSGRRGTQFAIEGSGADVWGAADAFYYVYQPLTNDGVITAQIITGQNTSSNAKCGVMMRASLDPAAPHFFVDLLPQNVVETLWRSAPAGTTAAHWVTNILTDPWVRVQRKGNLFTGYYSLDGTNWIQTSQQSIAMGGTIYAGLAVNSHDTTQMNESVFGNVSLVQPVPLQAKLAGGSIVLQWPASAGGFTLESTPTLGASAYWQPIGASVATNNGLNTVMVPASNRASFFRLRQ